MEQRHGLACILTIPAQLPLCDWPIPQPGDWLDRVNQPLTGAELDAMRQCADAASRTVVALGWKKRLGG